MQITMIPVTDSSTVIEYGYDNEKSALVVNYKRTGPYRYEGISLPEFESIAHAESIGKGIRQVAVNKLYSRISEGKDFIRTGPINPPTNR